MVFPGGVSEPVDGSPRWSQLLSSFGYTKEDFEALHRPAGDITPIFQDNPIQRHIALRITAIRETFEELGLLICSRQQKGDRAGLWADIIADIDVKYWQKRLTKDPAELLNLCEEYKCYPDIWSLHYWSNWLTPIHLPKRFDTAFFVAALEKKPEGIRSSSEVADVEWLTPAEVFKSNRQLYPPQLYELYRLAHVKDLSKLVQFAKQRSGHATEVSYPVILKAKDGHVSLLPGDDLYPTTLDFNDNTIEFIDKSILELRQGCKTLHRLEFTKKSKQFIIENYKPEHHIVMEDNTYLANTV